MELIILINIDRLNQCYAHPVGYALHEYPVNLAKWTFGPSRWQFGPTLEFRPEPNSLCRNAMAFRPSSYSARAEFPGISAFQPLHPHSFTHTTKF
jgi:hypothetical protein